MNASFQDQLSVGLNLQESQDDKNSVFEKSVVEVNQSIAAAVDQYQPLCIVIDDQSSILIPPSFQSQICHWQNDYEGLLTQELLDQAHPEKILETLIQLQSANQPAKTPGDQMWVRRSQNMMACVIHALMHERDIHKKIISKDDIRSNLLFDRLVEIECDQKLPERVREMVKNYLQSLPNFQYGLAKDQNAATMDNHGFLQMQWSRLFHELPSGLRPFRHAQYQNIVIHISTNNAKNLSAYEIIRNWMNRYHAGLLVFDCPAMMESFGKIFLTGQVGTLIDHDHLAICVKS